VNSLQGADSYLLSAPCRVSYKLSGIVPVNDVTLQYSQGKIMAKQYVLLRGNVRLLKSGVDRKKFIEDMTAKNIDCKTCKSPPSLKTMEKWMMDGVAQATDGCRIEPDGICIHGHKSWLMQMSLI
jgi:hypothetical protein